MPNGKVAIEGNGGQTYCAINELKLTERRVARLASVHLQRSEFFPAISVDANRNENRKPKEAGVARQFKGIDGTVPRQAKQRNHISYLAIESNTDVIQDFWNRRAGRNGKIFTLDLAVTNRPQVGEKWT